MLKPLNQLHLQSWCMKVLLLRVLAVLKYLLLNAPDVWRDGALSCEHHVMSRQHGQGCRFRRDLASQIVVSTRARQGLAPSNDQPHEVVVKNRHAVQTVEHDRAFGVI